MKTLILMIQALVLMGFLSGCGSDDNGSSPGSSDDIGAPNQNHIGWAVGSSADGYGTIIHTTNSGKTWKREGNSTTIPDAQMNDVAAVDQLNVWAVGESSPIINGPSYGTILHSSDAGKSWERQGTPESIPDAGFGGISAVNSQVAWVAGGAVGGAGLIMYTDDGGSHWTQQAEGNFPDTDLEMISAADKDNVWVVGSISSGGNTSAFIARTTDGGETWEQVSVNFLLNKLGLIDVHAVTADIIWAVGTDGTVAITIDGGETWVDNGPPVGPMHINGVCALDDKRAWVAEDGSNVFYTSDGGVSWTKQQGPKDNTDAPGVSSAYMGLTATSKHKVWLVGFGMPPNAVISHTVNGGKKWTDQSPSGIAALRRVSFVGDVK